MSFKGNETSGVKKKVKSPNPAAGCLMLIVDDNDELRILFKQLFEMEGYTVIEAVNGRDGVDAAIRERPQLILMNYLMPVMDGLKATVEIRRQPGLEKVPILLNSICSTEEMWEPAQRAGCDDFFEMPISPRKLIEKVRAYTSADNSAI
jgi:two-component system cell cycle response regulator DivK